MKRYLALLVAIVCSAELHAQMADNEQAKRVASHKQELSRSVSAQSIQSCPPTFVTIPTTINGHLTTSSCLDDLGGGTVLREDTFAFTGFAGQTVTIDYSSTAYSVFLWMPDGPFSTTISYLGTSGVSKERIVYTFPTTTTYTLEAESLYGIADPIASTGAYTLAISVSGGPSGSCIPDSTSACLLNNRFRATLRYRGAFDNATADTNALVKPVTGFGSSSYETAFFYFNSSNNIEMMVKMLDQGNTNGSGQPTIAVLYGSATPLRGELTITDTRTGATKHYTSQFGSQAGSTDFTAFVK